MLHTLLKVGKCFGLWSTMKLGSLIVKLNLCGRWYDNTQSESTCQHLTLIVLRIVFISNLVFNMTLERSTRRVRVCRVCKIVVLHSPLHGISFEYSLDDTTTVCSQAKRTHLLAKTAFKQARSFMGYASRPVLILRGSSSVPERRSVKSKQRLITSCLLKHMETCEHCIAVRNVWVPC